MTIEIIQVMAANGIPEDHWLQQPEYAWFKRGYRYAASQTLAIPALAKCSAAELYYAVSAVLRELERHPELLDSFRGETKRAQP